MSRATRVLVTGAAGQVGLDLMDVLRGDDTPGRRPVLPTRWPRRSRRGEFEVRGLRATTTWT